VDPKAALAEMLEDGWALDFEPEFNAEWYEAESQMPKIVVSHVMTMPRFAGFSDDLPGSSRRFEGTYAVDVWSVGDQSKRWRMLKEVDRIIHSKCDSPGGGLEFAEASSWRDLDEPNTHPRLYRSRVLVNVLYYG